MDKMMGKENAIFKNKDSKLGESIGTDKIKERF